MPPSYFEKIIVKSLEITHFWNHLKNCGISYWKWRNITSSTQSWKVKIKIPQPPTDLKNSGHLWFQNNIFLTFLSKVDFMQPSMIPWPPNPPPRNKWTATCKRKIFIRNNMNRLSINRDFHKRWIFLIMIWDNNC